MEKKHRIHGYTIEDSVSSWVNELDKDNVLLMHITSSGFDLNKEEENEFVKKHILGLLGAGAKASYMNEYIGSKEKIANKILKDWRDAEEKGEDITMEIWFSKE